MICIKTRFFTLCLFILAIFPGCSGSKNFVHSGDTQAIKSLLIFPVYSQIEVIENRDKRIKSDFFSSGAEAQIYKELEKYIPSDVRKIYPEFNDDLEPGIINSTIKLSRTARSSLSPKSVKIPALLLQVLDSLHEDYGLIILQAGFTRTRENEKIQYMRRRTTAFATLGFFDTEPNKSYSVMSGIILDRRNKKLLMYKELGFPNRNPNEEVVIRTQLRDIILSCFQKKAQ
jgi:hypothetical protein